MAKQCYICGINTIFYVWSTSRYFPKKALINRKGLRTKLETNKISTEGQTVCFKCYGELKKNENIDSV